MTYYVQDWELYQAIIGLTDEEYLAYEYELFEKIAQSFNIYGESNELINQKAIKQFNQEILPKDL